MLNIQQEKNNLKDPFPRELLKQIDLGHADGYRDSTIEQVFIQTASITQFNLDRHSVIIGSFGMGKSTLFKLLKDRSKKLPKFSEDLIVSIEEQMQFGQLRMIAKDYFPGIDQKPLYQLIWKLQVCRNIAFKISELNDFPKNKDEEYLKEFLFRCNFTDGSRSITDFMKDLISSCSFKIKASISETPLELEVGKEADKNKKENGYVEINLNSVVSKIESTLREREIKRALVIVDKLDKFVTNEDYKTQREYIESLLEVEDDMQFCEKIRFKIFIRSDLYSRLNLSSLGPDKLGDNTLKLEWSVAEINAFIARRLLESFNKAGIITIDEFFKSINISGYNLTWYDKILSSEKKDGLQYLFAKQWKRLFTKRRNVSLFEMLDSNVITMLFEQELTHTNNGGDQCKIGINSFFGTHFLDGHDSCTPRQILIFLKKLVGETINFFRENPDINVHTRMVNGCWGWEVFNPSIVYKAYVTAKRDYISHVAKIDDKWSAPFAQLLNHTGSKKTFDLKWIITNIEFKDESAEHFVTFLQVIGFFKPDSNELDLKKRKFTIPIIYKEACN